MSHYGLENFAFADVSASFTAGQTTLSFAVGQTARFNTFPLLGVLWNTKDYVSSHEAFVSGDAEILEVTSKSGDTFDVIIRAQDGTTAIATTPGATYRFEVVATRKQWGTVAEIDLDVSFNRVKQPFQEVTATTSTTLDFVNGNHVELAMNADITTLTLSNPRGGERYLLILTQDATGSRTITWPASVKWRGGIAPTLGGSNVVDIVSMIYSSKSSHFKADVGNAFS